MSENVQVAVRVRPFNDREIQAKTVACVRMLPDTQQTIITDVTTGVEKSFTFDFSYNSFVPQDNPEFASQDTVWNDLGIKVLEHAWEGFNVSLFAYGQTGSGKSFSMVGYGSDKGIIPRASEVIFERITAQNTAAEGADDNRAQIKVEASMMEIYNERVKDLFNPSMDNLKVRDHPKKGPYADGLTKHAVSSYSEINALMEAGIMARTTAATNMNATSSRAHTIFQIILTQSTTDPMTKKTMDKVSRINLIDLAGSERAASTGATGGRLKEGAAINQSLSSLGNCISALADNAALAKGKKKLVPYRNSKLTHLLKDSLGGNAKTIMIAALSPAAMNYSETLSTLRYADRAKQIKNKAIINEDPNQKLIRQLKEELDELKKAMTSSLSSSPSEENNAERPADITKTPAEAKQKEEELARIREQLEMNQKLLEESQKSWNDRLRETEELAKQREEQLRAIGLVSSTTMDVQAKALKEPYLLNLHEDLLMSEKLFYFLPLGKTHIGREANNKGEEGDTQDIVLGGLGILARHCHIERKMVQSKSGVDQDSISISLVPESGAKVFLNGKQVLENPKDPVLVNHCDRLVFGNNSIFRLVIPSLRELDDVAWKSSEGQYDWQFAMKELNSAQAHMWSKSSGEAEAEAEREAMAERLREMEARIAQEQDLAQATIATQRQEWEAQARALQVEMDEKEQALRKQIADDSAPASERQGAEEALATALADQEAKLAEDLAKAELEYQEKQDALLAKQSELESSLQQQIKETKVLASRKERERTERVLLDEALLYEISLVNEANSISEELTKHVGFALKLVPGAPNTKILSNPENDALAITDSIVGELRIQVNFQDQDSGMIRTALWETEKFNHRLVLMRHMYQEFIENGRQVQALNWTREEDPFFDPSDPELIGRAYVYLEALMYGFDIHDRTPIVDLNGKISAHLYVDISSDAKTRPWFQPQTPALVPLESETTPTNLDTIDIELFQLSQCPQESLEIKIVVQSIDALPAKYCKDVRVGFRWLEDDQVYVSKPCETATINPTLDFHTTLVEVLSPEVLNHLAHSPLEIEVFGTAPGHASSIQPSEDKLATQQQQEKDKREEAHVAKKSRKMSTLSQKTLEQKQQNQTPIYEEEPSAQIETLERQIAAQREELELQENTLIENTLELETSLHEVDHLQHQLKVETNSALALNQQLKKMTKQNEILRLKLKEQALRMKYPTTAPPVTPVVLDDDVPVEETPVVSPLETTNPAAVHPVPQVETKTKAANTLTLHSDLSKDKLQDNKSGQKNCIIS